MSTRFLGLPMGYLLRLDFTNYETSIGLFDGSAYRLCYQVMGSLKNGKGGQFDLMPLLANGDLVKLIDIIEAYSVAGGMGFGWWLVEHYLSYHVDCPDGCGLGSLLGVDSIHHTFRWAMDRLIT